MIWGPINFLSPSTAGRVISFSNLKGYIYIYIVIHRQTVSFYQNSSVWLDTQDARSRDRNPSKYIYIYIYIYIYMQYSLNQKNLVQWHRHMLSIFRRCPWFNGYRRRKWTQRHEFKSWTRLIAFHIALIPLGKVWIQLFSLQLWVNSRTDWVLQPCWGN